MIYFIIAWTLLTGTCWIIGTAVLNALNAKRFKRRGDRFIAALWLGVVLLAIALLAASLVFSLSPLVGGAIALSLVLLSLLSRRTRMEMQEFWAGMSSRFILGFFILEALIAALCTRQVTWYDVGIYHFGAIRWLAEYGAVPGLALIHAKFGFISSWFALAAPLNPEAFGSRVTAVTNGFALLLASLQLMMGLARLLTPKAQLADWFAAIFGAIAIPTMLLSPFLLVVAISPSPDLPIVFLTGVVAWAMLLVCQTPQGEANPNSSAVPLILAAGAVTIKLSALPILFVAWLFYLFGQKFSFKRVLWGSAIAMILLSPMIVFSVVTSGCPLYPSTVMCFDVPWSIPIERAISERADINGWMSWFGSPPTGVNYWLWAFGEWFKLASFNKVMIFAIAISVAIAIYIFKTFKFNEIKHLLWLFALGVLGIIYIMTQAPLIRFGLGYFMLIPSLLAAVYCYKKLNEILIPIASKLHDLAPGVKRPTVILFLSLFFASLAIVGIIGDNFRENLLLPPELPNAKVTQERVNGIEYFVPVDSNKCWATEIPCVPEEIVPNVRLQNPDRGLDGGFTQK